MLSKKLLQGAQELRQTMQQAENWISNAELHAQRITRVKDTYEKIEHQMQSLIARERVTLDSVTRSQISIEVNQGDIAGDQTDIQVDQTWDFAVTDAGSDIHRTFGRWDGNCQRSEEFQRRGATAQSIESWESACKQTLLERAKFGPIFRSIKEQRAALKSFQVTAQGHRKVLVEQSERIE